MPSQPTLFHPVLDVPSNRQLAPLYCRLIWKFCYFQMHFHCKPSFREASHRTYREVSKLVITIHPNLLLFFSFFLLLIFSVHRSIEAFKLSLIWTLNKPYTLQPAFRQLMLSEFLCKIARNFFHLCNSSKCSKLSSMESCFRNKINILFP